MDGELTSQKIPLLLGSTGTSNLWPIVYTIACAIGLHMSAHHATNVSGTDTVAKQHSLKLTGSTRYWAMHWFAHLSIHVVHQLQLPINMPLNYSYPR